MTAPTKAIHSKSRFPDQVVAAIFQANERLQLDGELWQVVRMEYLPTRPVLLIPGHATNLATHSRRDRPLTQTRRITHALLALLLGAAVGAVVPLPSLGAATVAHCSAH